MAHDKRLESAYSSFDRSKSYPLSEAVKLGRPMPGPSSTRRSRSA